MNLYAVQTRDEETAGHYGTYTFYVRAESHKAAALFFVKHDDQSWEDDVTVVQIPLVDGPEGFAGQGAPGDDWPEEEFSIAALRSTLGIQHED